MKAFIAVAVLFCSLSASAQVIIDKTSLPPKVARFMRGPVIDVRGLDVERKAKVLEALIGRSLTFVNFREYEKEKVYFANFFPEGLLTSVSTKEIFISNGTGLLSFSDKMTSRGPKIASIGNLSEGSPTHRTISTYGIDFIVVDHWRGSCDPLLSLISEFTEAAE